MKLTKRHIAGLLFFPIAVLVVSLLVGTNPESNLSAQNKTQSFKLDTVHSSLLFKVSHFGISYTYGRFIDFDGSLQFDQEQPENSSISLTAKSDSVRTWSKKRDNHLKSPDFLNAKQYPEITFKSTSVKKVSENHYKVTGDFTLHGTTKEISIDVNKTGEGKGPNGNFRIGFHTTFDITRSKYGMDQMVGPAGDNVEIIISTEFIKN